MHITNLELGIRTIASMNEDEFTHWLRKSLSNGPHPFKTAPDDYNATALSELPSLLPIDLSIRFRTSLSNLLVSFSSRPSDWREEETEELLVLASLIGTNAVPGREPCDLGFTISIAQLVSSKWEAFTKLSNKIQARVLGLLRSGPIHLHPAFWMKLSKRSRMEYATVAWRGLLRDDWLTACSRILCKIPDTDSSRRAIKNHAVFAAEHLKHSDGAEKLSQLRAAMFLARPGIQNELIECLSSSGIRLIPQKNGKILFPVHTEVTSLLSSYRLKFHRVASHPLGEIIEVPLKDAPKIIILLEAFELAIHSGETEHWRLISIAENYQRAHLSLSAGYFVKSKPKRKTSKQSSGPLSRPLVNKAKKEGFDPEDSVKKQITGIIIDATSYFKQPQSTTQKTSRKTS